MEINVKEREKIVELWLTNAEKRDEVIRERYQRLCSQYKAKGYFPVVYFSGCENLLENTSYLLRGNRKRMAQKEVERER